MFHLNSLENDVKNRVIVYNCHKTLQVASVHSKCIDLDIHNLSIRSSTSIQSTAVSSTEKRMRNWDTDWEKNPFDLEKCNQFNVMVRICPRPMHSHWMVNKSRIHEKVKFTNFFIISDGIEGRQEILKPKKKKDGKMILWKKWMVRRGGREKWWIFYWASNLAIIIANHNKQRATGR